MLVSRFKLSAVVLGLGLALAGLPMGATTGRAEVPAHELLRNGLEALADEQPTEARMAFDKLISAYPQSPEAAAAKRELNKLDDANLVPDADGGTDDPSSQAPSSQATTDAPDARGSVASAEELDPQKPANTPTLRARRAFVTAVGDRVFFAENSAAIGGRARSTLESQGRWLAQHPSIKITLIGRADDGGAGAQAHDLSLQRAEAVKAKLIEAGVSASVVAIEARGATDPIATCRSPLCQAQNRCVETLVTVMPQPDAKTSFDSSMPPRTRAGTAVSVQTPAGPVAR